MAALVVGAGDELRPSVSKEPYSHSELHVVDEQRDWTGYKGKKAETHRRADLRVVVNVPRVTMLDTHLADNTTEAAGKMYDDLCLKRVGVSTRRHL